MRECRVCKAVKPLTEFYASKRYGPAKVCKICDNKARGERDKKDRAGARRRYADWLARPGNKEKTQAYYRKHYADNKERYMRNTLNRIARLKGAQGKHSLQQIRELKSRQKNKCVACHADVSVKYHVDHIVPLIKGGTNDITNIQILCPTCNMSKQARDPITFMQSRGLLL